MTSPEEVISLADVMRTKAKLRLPVLVDVARVGAGCESENHRDHALTRRGLGAGARRGC